ncbi:glycosyltransferase family 2 protein [Klebsiella oxytoca]|uniref:glycosyltransferase family 2 protein n=1 Tax=Klebsiella oxytoca TaxID=571 RepID=UPI00259372DF|nr:glycosyltransferase family 2 protein [Klebsiella oxytoca]MDM4397168.1 glycosyltransferase family 2 protein [Klebsiella oxytoca]MDM4420580.1 glycosyltransferase family 2 protein [Klebsiella oxytoca]
MKEEIKNNFFIAIPTFNGGQVWETVAKSIKKNCPKDTSIFIIDSGSKDNTLGIAHELGFNVSTIESKNFNHGATRNLLADLAPAECDVVIFLTQDAIPQHGFVERIVSVFNDENVVCAYGRQLPHDDANPIASHARYFNYPMETHIYSADDISVKGLKTVFMSNSFSAYRLSVFKKLGGFPSNTILCEDMYYTAKAIKNGFKSAYIADAKVKHSHNYHIIEEFRRYFDIGVFHANEPWIRKEFGGAGGEGKKFISSEFNYLLKRSVKYIPLAFINNFMKLLGYKIGLNYKKLPVSFTKWCSMHKAYWKCKE